MRTPCRGLPTGSTSQPMPEPSLMAPTGRWETSRAKKKWVRTQPQAHPAPQGPAITIILPAAIARPRGKRSIDIESRVVESGNQGLATELAQPVEHPREAGIFSSRRWLKSPALGEPSLGSGSDCALRRSKLDAACPCRRETGVHRSRMISRSNSASNGHQNVKLKETNRVPVRRINALSVATSATPCRASSSSIKARCGSERPRRSSLNTTTCSILPARTATIRASRPGRTNLAPEI